MGYYGYGFRYYFDPTYMLVIIGAVLCLWAQARVSSTYSKFSRVQSRTGMTGAQAAQRILQMSGIYDVRIEHVGGSLTDHYDPGHKVLRLSDSVYGSTSVAAIGVAAIVYFALILLTKAISKEDLALMPKGDKIARLLRIQ